MRKKKFAAIFCIASFIFSTSGGHAANVAIIDTGIYNIPGWIDSSVRDYMGEWDHVYNDWYPYDHNGHGVRVTLAFLNYALGIPEAAPRVTALRAGNASGGFPVYATYNALNDAAGVLNNWSRYNSGGPLRLTGDYAIDVINMSFGGEGYNVFNHIAMNNVYFYSDALMVIAAGNSGGAEPLYPANLARFMGTRGIAVGACDPAGNMHPYSNRAGTLSPYSYICAHAEASGPWAGTSFAAPRVAGTASIIKDRWPHLTGAQIGDILLSTATDRGAPGVDPVYGRGMMNWGAALSPVGGRWYSLGGQAYNYAGSNIRVSTVLGEISRVGQSVSFFDRFDRDFETTIAVARAPISSLLKREMQSPYLGPRNHNVSEMGRTGWSFSSNLATERPNSLEDLSFGLRFNNHKGVTHIGYGEKTVGIRSPNAFSSTFFETDVTASGINPILNLAGDGVQLNTELNIGANVSLTSGFAANDEGLGWGDVNSSARALFLGISAFSNDKKWKTNLNATHLSERDGLLGSRITGAFGNGVGAGTKSLTLSSDWQFGKDVVFSGAYTVAQSNTIRRDARILEVNKRLNSNAMAVGLSKKGVFDDEDQLYVSVSQPLRLSNGQARLTYDDHYDEDMNLVSNTVDIDLRPTGREIDVQLGYATALNDGGKMKFLLYHAHDYRHVAGSHGTGALARFEWSFD